MPIDKDEFRAALSRFASGVTVVTTKDTDGNLHGLTVSAFCSVSLEPPLILICIDKHTASHNAFQQSNRFVVNVLREEQTQYANRCFGAISTIAGWILPFIERMSPSLLHPCDRVSNFKNREVLSAPTRSGSIPVS